MVTSVKVDHSNLKPNTLRVQLT